MKKDNLSDYAIHGSLLAAVGWAWGDLVKTYKQKRLAHKISGQLSEEGSGKKSPDFNLITAISNRDELKAREMMGRGADPWGRDALEDSAVKLALTVDAGACLAAMLEAPAAREKMEAWRVLREAARDGASECVAALLAAGADPNAKDARLRTPLGVACERSDFGMVRQMIAAGGRGEGLWRVAKKAKDRGEREIFDALVQAGAPASGMEALARECSEMEGAPAPIRLALRWTADRMRPASAMAPRVPAPVKTEKKKKESKGQAEAPTELSWAEAGELLAKADIGARARRLSGECLRQARELAPEGPLPAEPSDAFELRRLWEVNIPKLLNALAGIPAQERGVAEEGGPSPREGVERALETASEIMSDMRLRALRQARLRLEGEIAVMEDKGSRAAERRRYEEEDPK